MDWLEAGRAAWHCGLTEYTALGIIIIICAVSFLEQKGTKYGMIWLDVEVGDLNMLSCMSCTCCTLYV